MRLDDLWILPGKRTAFCKVDSSLSQRGAIDLSLPVVRAMDDEVDGGSDAVVWGSVAPNLAYSNIAREIWLDANLDPSTTAISTQMACATSLMSVFDAIPLIARGDSEIALCGGVESMSNVQIGLNQDLSNWLRRAGKIKSPGDALQAFAKLSLGDIGLHIPSIENRSTGMSMGEHCEEMAEEWGIPRGRQDRLALASHEKAVAGREKGFFDDLIVEVDGTSNDAFPRPDTSLEALEGLPPAFDPEDGTVTAGNSSPLTDGAAGVWLATDEGLDRFDSDRRRVKLVDWEVAGIDIFNEGLLMAPAYAIPRMLERRDLDYEDVDLWEIHEAFAAQLACHFRALESESFLEERVGTERDFGEIPEERVNPNGGSVALGHPFGATGGRILSQAAKELAEMESGSRGIVSICANGGLGAVALLEAA